MNWSCIWRLFASDITPEERIVLLKLLGRRGWHVALGVFAAYALGGLSYFGLPGFARAGDITSIQKDMADVKMTLVTARMQELPEKILNATQNWCKSMGDAKPLRFKAMTDLRQEYFGLFKREFERVRCEDLQ
jgi:hypothetical protein